MVENLMLLTIAAHKASKVQNQILSWLEALKMNLQAFN
jgi:hypothetical protein